MPGSNPRGMTLLELNLALLIIAVLTLGIATIFRLGIVQNKLATAETTVLFNVRKALHGDGKSDGMIFDALYASSATALSPAALAVYNPDNANLSYSLSSGTYLLLTSTSQAKTLATGISTMTISYYNMDSSGLIMVSTLPANAELFTASIRLSLPKRTVTFYSGALSRNHR